MYIVVDLQAEFCVSWSHVAPQKSTKLWRLQRLPLATGARCLEWRERGS